MKTSSKLIYPAFSIWNRWNIWLFIGLLILPFNALKAVHIFPENTVLSILRSPCASPGSESDDAMFLAFKELSKKEKKHVMQQAKYECPRRYEALKQYKAKVFWTDVWHVVRIILLIPVIIVIWIIKDKWESWWEE